MHNWKKAAAQYRHTLRILLGFDTQARIYDVKNAIGARFMVDMARDAMGNVPNYIEYGLKDERGAFTVTIQRQGAESSGQHAARLQKEILNLKRIIAGGKSKIRAKVWEK